MQNQVSQLNDQLGNGGMVQKLFSTSRYLAISIRIPGQTFWLYLGRGGGHEGLWLADLSPESSLRTIDGMLEYLRKHLSSTGFLGLEMDPVDRCICFKYQKWGKENRFYYFYRGRESYFAHHFWTQKGEKNFVSWQGYRENSVSFETFDEIGRKEQESPKEQKIKPIGELLKNEAKASSSSKGARKEKASQKRKVVNIKNDLLKIQKWKKLQEQAIQWKNELGEGRDCELVEMKNKVSIEGIKFNFKGCENSFQKLDILFGKLKRLKEVEGMMEARLQKNLDKLHKHQDLGQKLKAIKPVWHISKKKIPEKSDFEYFDLTFQAMNVRIGKNAQSNDGLRSKWSKKDDWWFHIENVPSAHLYFKNTKNLAFTPEVLETLGSALKHFSKYTSDQVPLIYTQVKNLKGVKGKAGSVFFKKEKRIVIQFNSSWEKNCE